MASHADLCRWIAPPNLHLTLHFLGATPPDKEDALKSELAGLPLPPAFCETLDRFLPFPSWSRAGVFTLASPAASPPLAALWNLLAPLLKKHGLEIQERTLMPHVTLARFQRRVRLSLEAFPALTPVRFAVETLTLYESIPTKKGSQYEPLADFSLARP